MQGKITHYLNMMNSLIGQRACSRYIASNIECAKNYIIVTLLQNKASDN